MAHHSTMLHLDAADDHIRVHAFAHAAHELLGQTVPAIPMVHITIGRIGSVDIMLRREQAERLRDALAEALAAPAEQDAEVAP